MAPPRGLSARPVRIGDFPASRTEARLHFANPRNNLPMKFLSRSLLLILGTATALLAAQPVPTPWNVGVATRKLTPAGPIWLAGYANRATPSDGVDQDVFAKALAVDDGKGGRVVIVTLDLIGVPHPL